MSDIPLYTQTSYDWHCQKNQPNKPYAVDLNVGTNEYIFGRTTPNNKFIVSTGLINDPKPYGIQMVGGKKKKFKTTKATNSKKGGNLFESKLAQNAGIYNEQNYKHNELIYNALTKSAELKGVQSYFNNDMIDAQNNIVGGAKKKSSTKKKSTSKTTLKKTTSKKATSKKTTPKKTTPKKTTAKKSKSKKGGHIEVSHPAPLTPEFGMNPGVGTQMAVNTDAPNALLKQMKSMPLEKMSVDMKGGKKSVKKTSVKKKSTSKTSKSKTPKETKPKKKTTSKTIKKTSSKTKKTTKTTKTVSKKK